MIRRKKPPLRAHSRAGFSLVETVAAMGILALAAVPLIQLTSEATRNTAQLDSRFLARTVAENVMARAFATSEPIEAGIQLGVETQLSRTYAWTQLVGPLDASGLQAIEVSVVRENDTQILARLVSVKTTPIALPQNTNNPDNMPPNPSLGGAQ